MDKVIKKVEYPKWICDACGDSYGRRTITISTYHIDTCGWCHREAACTEPRDWGYPEYAPEREIK